VTGDSFRTPDYVGGGLLNLTAEIERRLIGDAPHPGLDPDLASRLPDGESYVLVLFDGLGDHQLEHSAASSLRRDRVGAVDASFPTTTTVSMATIATGRSPTEHGLLAYQLWLPEVGEVVNTIQWTTPWGSPIEHDVDGFLPEPNLWERLAAAGVEPITLQPWDFDRSAMSRMLYRGARFEPWDDEDDAVDAALALAEVPGRLIFLSVPHVDFAAHVGGQGDEGYDEAMGIVDRLWGRLAGRLPERAVLVGTADHGHVDIAAERQIRLSRADHEDTILYGDPRAMFVIGDGATLSERYPATWVPRSEMQHWWGPGDPHPALPARAPDGVLVADDGHALLHRHADDRLVGQHGALTEEELRVPLLVGHG
jgi:hypothetical protein